MAFTKQSKGALPVARLLFINIIAEYNCSVYLIMIHFPPSPHTLFTLFVINYNNYLIILQKCKYGQYLTLFICYLLNFYTKSSCNKKNKYTLRNILKPVQRNSNQILIQSIRTSHTLTLLQIMLMTLIIL